MKTDKILKLFFAVIFALTMFTGYTAFSLRNTEKVIIPTTLYTKKEINSAMNTVACHFTIHYPDCKLLQLYTNENSDTEDNTLVIYSDFYVGTDENRHPSMEPDEIYRKWQFEMKNVFGLWFIVNNGYG